MNPYSTSPADLRSEIARVWDGPLYLLASAVPIHPVYLSAVLHERLPLKPALAARIFEILRARQETHAG